MDTSKPIYPTLPIAERLRNLPDLLPGQSQLLYHFARHVADRLTPSHIEPHGIYGDVFAGDALRAIVEMRFLPSEKDVQTVYGYNFSKELLGHSMGVYIDLFDKIPEMFFAVTDGKLKEEISKETERQRRCIPKRLDSLDPKIGKFVSERPNSLEMKRARYRSVRDGREFDANQIEYVGLPSSLHGYVAELAEVPQLLFCGDADHAYCCRTEPEFFVPIERHKGIVPAVAWAVLKENAEVD
jgi:hypothetical protein